MIVKEHSLLSYKEFCFLSLRIVCSLRFVEIDKWLKDLMRRLLFVILILFVYILLLVFFVFLGYNQNNDKAQDELMFKLSLFTSAYMIIMKAHPVLGLILLLAIFVQFHDRK